MAGIRRSVKESCIVLLVAAAWMFFLPYAAGAADWQVKPIRLDLGGRTKTGAITVINEGTTAIRYQVNALAWAQDEEGRDVYTETGDVIFFPKILTVEGGGEKIIRAGVRNPVTVREKTYRLFIEEIPEPRKEGGAGVSIAIRFGVPVFVNPKKADVRGEVGEIRVAKGEIVFRVKNEGNVHFVITSMRIAGKDAAGGTVFEKELSGWYLLNGASRTYAAPLPEDRCGDVRSIALTVTTDKQPLTGALTFPQGMCTPQDR